MVYKFIFFIGYNRHFIGQLESEFCSFIKTNGQHCGRKCTFGIEYCYQHLEKEKHLKIKKSLIPNAGKGLFAWDKTKDDDEIIFRKNSNIIAYKGELIDLNELNRRYGEYTGPYAIQINRNEFDDSALIRGVASLINSNRNNQNCNTKFSLYRGVMNIKATKDIRNGEELIINYGRQYRFNENTHYTTKYFRYP